MPIATLNFSLPEEENAYNTARRGGAYQAVVAVLAMDLRNKLKYGHTYKTPDEALEALKSLLWDECSERYLDPFGD